MTFKVPDSYRAYCTDAAVKTAVDHILDSRSLSLPEDIEWKDLPAFHRAVLSAHQVRCDFAIFLIDVWNAVWKPMLEQSDFGTNTEPCSVAESQRRFGQNVDTMEVWKTTWFGRAFTSADFYFVLGICSDAKCVQLSISFYDADEADRTTQIDPGDSWPRRDIADGVAYSSTRLAPIRDDGIIDLGPLCEAGDNALVAVKTYLPT